MYVYLVPQPYFIRMFKNLLLNSVKMAYASKKNQVPTYTFMWQKFSRIIAFGFGSGLTAILPGTRGTLIACIAFNVLNLYHLDIRLFALLFISMLVLGAWACNQTQHSIQKIDSGYIVIDEWLGIWLCLWAISYIETVNLRNLSFSKQIAIFFVFRLFDMWKPYPIKNIESYFKQHVKSNSFLSGFGIMFDDILAAVYTILIFKLF
jgi:phosphatidylglycerophosphatase A